MRKEIFTLALREVTAHAKILGIDIINSTELDAYFKGDMDGVHIWTRFTNSDSDDEEELFSVLHMIGHTIQWALSEELRSLGSVLHKEPTNGLIIRLQEYEYEANCYALYLLETVVMPSLSYDYRQELRKWLNDKYKEDMVLLTHFYKTGEKIHDFEKAAKSWIGRIEPLSPKDIPPFTPVQIKGTRNGLVIDF